MIFMIFSLYELATFHHMLFGGHHNTSHAIGPGPMTNSLDQLKQQFLATSKLVAMYSTTHTHIHVYIYMYIYIYIY